MDATIGATIVASVINSTSLNCRTNSSSSSSSSGYASGHSTASTPATPISCQYDSSTHVALTPVSAVEHLPTATVAPVAPFYSEATLGQQQRQQYYQSYPYANSVAQYNPVYDAYTGNSYHNLTTPSIERNLGNITHGVHSGNSSQQRQEKQSKNLSSHHASGVAVTQHYSTSSSSLVTTTTCATTKPQATATPFFAQPSTNVNTSAGMYYDAYNKYKLSSGTKFASQSSPEYASNYTNHLQHAAAATWSYQQQQQHYYAAKSQLQDNYAAAVVKPHRQLNVANTAAYYGSSGAYYDKYIYGQTANGTAYGTSVPPTVHAPPPHPYSPQEPTTADPYRKAAIYLAAPNGASSSRDSFCAATTDKYGKYEKYSAYFPSHHHPQSYMAPPTHSTVSGATANTRNFWPNSAHHTSHLTPVPAVINDRLAHTLPPSAPQHHPQTHAHTHAHAHAHGNTHYPYGSTGSATAQRQSCCSQPFQQQTCYYPRPTQPTYPHGGAPSAYATTQPPHFGASSSSSGNLKYTTYGSTYKTSNNNDLYLNSPFDTPPAAYNYGSASATAMQQRYSSVTGTGTAFYNDLNLHSAFESYAGNTISQSTIMQPHMSGAHNVAKHHQTLPTHLSYAAHGTGQNNSATAALLEYRKPVTAAANDCCLSSARVPLTNLDQHAATNTPGYLTYDMHGNPIAQAHAVITSPTIYSDGGSSSEKSTPTTKNLSLRDFLATWNEEEEEDLNNTEQLAFMNENSITESNRYVTETTIEGSTATIPLSVTPQTSQTHSSQPQQQYIGDQQFSTYKNTSQTRPKIHVGITVDGTMDVDTSQYINLPDIIIDIEKSNNVATPTPTPTGAQTVETTTPQPLLQHHSPCDAHDVFENFDVEKELDELQIKRAKMCLEKQLNNEIRILTPEPIVPANNDKNESEHAEVPQTQNVNTFPHTECEKSYDNTENFLKDIELNDNNSHSSNSSTFEKEYETFINRIDLDKVCTDREQNVRKEAVIVMHQSGLINEDSGSVSQQSSDIKTPPDPVQPRETTLEGSRQNLHDFTTFYKKKRKLVQDNSDCEVSHPMFKQLKAEEITVAVEKQDSTDVMEKRNEASQMLRKPKRTIKRFWKNARTRRRPLSQFYKLLRQGRLRINSSKLVQKHIAKMKKRHLPLIKRQSFKNYTTSDNIIYNPRSLMHLTVSVVNTNDFQKKLLVELERKQKFPEKGTIFSRIEKEISTMMEKAEVDAQIAKENSDLKTILEEQNMNSNSENGSDSLKVQEDFNGFEDNQNLRISPVLAIPLGSTSVVTVVRKTYENLPQEDSSLGNDDLSSRDADCMALEDINSENMKPEVSNQVNCGILQRTESIIVEIGSKGVVKSTPLEKFQNDNAEKKSTALEPDLKSKEEVVETKMNKIIEHTAVDEQPEETKVSNSSEGIVTTEKATFQSAEINNSVNPNNEDDNNHQELSTAEEPDNSKIFPSTKLRPELYTPIQVQNLPVMRTKASVKMCDFSNIQHKHSSTKYRSKSVSPTSTECKKPNFHTKRKVSASIFDGIEKIDKTKFIKEWAMNATETFSKNQQKILGALDLSPTSENLEKKTTSIPMEEDLNSSTETSSSTESSETTLSDNKSRSSTKTSSSSSSMSSSSSSSTTSKSSKNTAKSKSTAITNHSSCNSTNVSEFNELRALEKELSQHNTCSEFTSTVIANNVGKETNIVTDSQEFNVSNSKKTDKENVSSEAQDIADLKKILECEHDDDSAVLKDQDGVSDGGCSEAIHAKVDVCVDLKSDGEQSSSLGGIAEVILSREEKNSKDNNDIAEENIKKCQKNQQENQQSQQQEVVIPKLSDLCKIALNSSSIRKSLNISQNVTKVVEVEIKPKKDESVPPSTPKSMKSSMESPKSPISLQTNEAVHPNHECRELTVEEALAEMYHQVGVFSDPEDNADDVLHQASDNGENQAQDYLLINLAEILDNSDTENNVFVLQCDMNENVLRVVATSPNSLEVDEVTGVTGDDSVNALQLVQLLNGNNLEIVEESNNITEGLQEDHYSMVNLNEDDSYSAIADLPIIHHEEIVPDNYKKFQKEQFLKYLHAKYVQKNVKKFHHANRILKKYRRRLIVKRISNSIGADHRGRL